jgi:hypothetical protein
VTISRGIGELADAGEGGLQLAAIRGDEAVGLELDADALASQPEIARQSEQILRRIGIAAVLPDPDIGEVRGVLRLAIIGGAGQQRHGAVGLHDQALEEAEAEGVVAGEPEHRFLLKQEEGVEAVALHGGEQRVAAAAEFC